MGEVSTLPVGVGRETDGTAGEKHTPQLLHVKTENGRCGSVAMVAVQHCNIDVYVWYVHGVSVVSATPLCTSLDSNATSSFVSSLKVYMYMYITYNVLNDHSNPYIESTTVLSDTGILNQAI